MLLLPPASPAARNDRRVRERRKVDRVTPAAETDARFASAVDETPRVKPEIAGGRRWRIGGRRSGDKAAGPEAVGDRKTAQRPFAPLVAQLIATALGLEQTRRRRRGTVEDATALYTAKPSRAKPRGEA